MQRISAKDKTLISQNLEEEFSILDGKGVLITGATGLFGKWLLEAFQEARANFKCNIKLILLSRNWQKFKSKNSGLLESLDVELIEGDIRDFPWPNEKVDYVIHAASEVDQVKAVNEPKEVYSSIVDGSKYVFEASRKAGVSRLLFVSSGAVYGSAIGDSLLTEDQVIRGEELYSSYAKGKRDVEELAHSYILNKALEIVTLRGFAVVGPYMSIEKKFAASQFFKSALCHENIQVLGDGRDGRSYLYMADVAIWLLKALIRGGSGEVYNMGSDEVTSIKDLAQLIASQSLSTLKVEVLDKQNLSLAGGRRKNNEVPVFAPDISKSVKELGVRVYTPLEKSIEKTWEWFNAIEP